MTLDETITSCMKVVSEEMELYREICPTAYLVSPVCTETAKIHFQLAEWLEELKQRRKLPGVRHGRWIVKGQEIYCSECNEESLYNPFGASKFSRFCPNCGAELEVT